MPAVVAPSPWRCFAVFIRIILTRPFGFGFGYSVGPIARPEDCALQVSTVKTT